ncbi:IclR family transcriptional regulator [Actinomadura napierensis]|uniref:IclR family transcriptional regulator n=1 Tax=Actinomadura napierensis TaxID=267854 RepID=A0ABP5L8F2_9ACTN
MRNGGLAARPAPAPPRPTVTSRVLDIIGAFTPDRPALTITQIARRAGLPLSTAHRLVGELTCWGALERDGTGLYRIGLRLWEVGALARGPVLREAAMPFLEDLYEATHENVHLAVLDGLDVVYIERISARDAVHVFSRVAGRWPAHATGVGLAMLAHADPELQERAIAGPLRGFTPRTITTGPELRRVLAEVRRTGAAVSDGQVETFAMSVGAPVFGPDDTVVAAVAIVVPASGWEARSLVPVVRAAARGISRALGAPRALRRPESARREG